MVLLFALSREKTNVLVPGTAIRDFKNSNPVVLGIAQSVQLSPMYQKVLGSIPGAANSAYEKHIVREVLGAEDRCGALSSAFHLPEV